MPQVDSLLHRIVIFELAKVPLIATTPMAKITLSTTAVGTGSFIRGIYLP
jgi:hypothetical protein